MLGLLAGITIAVLVARALIRSLRVLRTSALDVAERRLPQAVESMRAGRDPGRHGRPGAADRSRRGRSRWPGRSTRCTGRRSGSPPTRPRCSPTSAPCSSTSRDAARRSSSASCSSSSSWRATSRTPTSCPTCSSSTTSPPACGATARTCWCSPAPTWPSATWLPVPMVDVLRAAVSEVEQYQRIVVQSPADGHHRRPRGIRPRPPARRAAGQRHQLLPAGLAGGHEHHPHLRRLDRGRDRRPRRQHERPRARRRQPAARRAVDGRRVRRPAHGPVRGRPVGDPARRRACD